MVKEWRIGEHGFYYNPYTEMEVEVEVRGYSTNGMLFVRSLKNNMPYRIEKSELREE